MLGIRRERQGVNNASLRTTTGGDGLDPADKIFVENPRVHRCEGIVEPLNQLAGRCAFGNGETEVSEYRSQRLPPIGIGGDGSGMVKIDL